MTFHQTSPGKNVSDEFNVVIETPMNADPIKCSCEIERVRRAP